jgi:hypothetical protein
MELNLLQLYKLRRSLIKENKQDSYEMIEVINSIEKIERMMIEDTSATGGPSVGGMGAVVSAQPSGLAGQTIGPNWASGGGTVGSGDISVPYNPSGSNRMQQKIPVMGFEHGPRTGKKSRKKRLDLKHLKDVLSKRQDYTAGQSERGSSAKRVMDFDDYLKKSFDKVKK